jgi:DivIVA domain-containing protein
VDIDRQAIERRDFPIGRRGYDPAAVDAHLRALAAEFEELQRASTGAGAEPSLASTAATQVQSILAAAETAAADIERQALKDAGEAREQADRDAERTREDAIAQARAHVAGVGQATAVLLERVSAMDGETGALVESLRAGASRLAGDLATVGTNMGELYDAASGRVPADAAASSDAPPPPAVASSAFGPPQPAAPRPPRSAGDEPPAGKATEVTRPEPALAPAPAEQDAAGAPAGADGDLDSARLIALNMALNGESRDEAERYLAENFKLADRGQLIDEVYAAIEG